MPDEEKPFVDATRIEPIELDDVHGRWRFDPKPDITPLEAVLINHLFAVIVVRYLKGPGSRLDWREYLTRDWGRNMKLEPIPEFDRHHNDPELRLQVDAKVEPWRHFKELDN